MADGNSFFDKVKGVAKDTADNAKKATEKAKLKHEISGLESKKKENFCAIGKLFYEASVGAPEEKYATLFAAIEDATEEIQKKQKEIAEMDTLVACPNCGKRIRPDVAFCSQCGMKMEQPAPEPAPAPQQNTTFCPGCGTSVPGEAAFCPGCGAKITRPDVVEVPKNDVTVE